MSTSMQKIVRLNFGKRNVSMKKPLKNYTPPPLNTTQDIVESWVNLPFKKIFEAIFKKFKVIAF